MAHRTTIPAQVCTGMPSPAWGGLAPGHKAGRHRVEEPWPERRCRVGSGHRPSTPTASALLPGLPAV
jgi:hypothetical protein